jgi:hypothetical protein
VAGFAAILVWEEVDDLPHHAALSGWLLLLITGEHKFYIIYVTLVSKTYSLTFWNSCCIIGLAAAAHHRWFLQ